MTTHGPVCGKRLRHVPFVRMGNVYDRAFGRQVRDFRRALGWTQDDLAERLTAAGFPMHQTTIAKLEAGSRPTSVGEIATIAALFDVPVGTLFERPRHMEVRIYLAGLKSTIDSIEREQDQLRERLAELDKERTEAQVKYREYQDLAALEGFPKLTEGGPS